MLWYWKKSFAFKLRLPKKGDKFGKQSPGRKSRHRCMVLFFRAQQGDPYYPVVELVNINTDQVLNNLPVYIYAKVASAGDL